MGFSLGNGLSAAGYAAGEMYAKGALMDAQNEQEINRAMRLAEFKSALDSRTAEAARQGQVARIDAKAGALADEAIAPKRGLIDAGIADRSTWTPEQQAAVDQSLVADRQALMGDPMTRFKAGVSTGDVDLKDAASVELGERRAEREEQKGDRRYEIDSKRIDQQIKHQDDTLKETIRHNKALEASAATRADKLSAAAKAQLEIASNGVNSAHKELSVAARALDAATKSTEFDPEKKKADIAAARTEFMAAKNAVAIANSHYNRVGAAHLGGDWKVIEDEKPAEAAKPTPNAAALAALAKDPSKRADFIAKYGEANLPTAPAKPAGNAPLIGGTSGSHSGAPPDDTQDRNLRAQIMEKRGRLKLQGISEEVKLGLMLDIKKLEDQINGSSLNRTSR